MDRGAWWATVRGVANSWTRLKQLSTQHLFLSMIFFPNIFLTVANDTPPHPTCARDTWGNQGLERGGDWPGSQ